MIGEPTGVTPPRAVALPATAFFSGTRWSPDGKQILVEDNHNNLWAIEVASGAPTKIDTDSYPDPIRDFNATWSPDSKWITYSKNLASHLRAIFLDAVSVPPQSGLESRPLSTGTHSGRAARCTYGAE